LVGRALPLFAGLMIVGIVVLSYSVALLIPGQVGGNPIFESTVKGAKEMAQKLGIDLKVVEAGYNMSRWGSILMGLSATGKYDLIITLTEGMPENVEKSARMFPRIKYAIIDGVSRSKLPNVFSIGFRDEEMSFLAGYFAGLVTTSSMENSNSDLKVGLIAGDIYPTMMRKIKPGFENGAKAVNEEIKVLFSVVGSWHDPKKGEELAEMMFKEGVDVVFMVAGGSNAGIIRKAEDMKKYLIGVDANIIHLSPNTILACVLKRCDLAVKYIMEKAYEGKLKFGTFEIWGVKEGAIDFTFDDPNYLRNVPNDIRVKMKGIYEELKKGSISPLGSSK